MKNAFSPCTALNGTNVLEEYNKDFVSFARAHFSHNNIVVSNHNFPKAPLQYTQLGVG